MWMLALMCLGAWACGETTPPGDEVVARFGDRKVRRSELQRPEVPPGFNAIELMAADLVSLVAKREVQERARRLDMAAEQWRLERLCALGVLRPGTDCENIDPSEHVDKGDGMFSTSQLLARMQIAAERIGRKRLLHEEEYRWQARVVLRNRHKIADPTEDDVTETLGRLLLEHEYSAWTTEFARANLVVLDETLRTAVEAHMSWREDALSRLGGSAETIPWTEWDLWKDWVAEAEAKADAERARESSKDGAPEATS
ncbi:MAG: hypothetical protein KF858_01335 [Candidatus Sumerlaeia bacterium]|nr:hypothetical protein [Candidatus Sumerlaeia bacterium]